jgi:hypothetical protein
MTFCGVKLGSVLRMQIFGRLFKLLGGLPVYSVFTLLIGICNSFNDLRAGITGIRLVYGDI